MMTRQTLVLQTASDLHEVEESCDASLHTTVGAITRLIEARRSTGLSVTVGHEVLSDMQEAATALTTARGAIVSAHKRAEAFARKWGVSAQAPTDKDDPDAYRGVAAARAVS